MRTNRPRQGFLAELALGRYVAGDSPLHLAPVLGKAVLLAAVAVAGLWWQSASAFALLGLSLAALAGLAGIPQIQFWRSLRPLLLLAAFTILAGALWNHSDSALMAPRFSWSGLHHGAVYAARLLLITLLTTLFFFTTAPDEAISLGVRLMTPLRLLGIEQRELSLLVHLAYRFVPLLGREIEEMRLGRRARNLTPTGGLLGKARDAGDSLVTIIIGALHRAETTGLAIEQRGLLENWRPTPLAGGRAILLWPLVAVCLLCGLLVRFDGGLL